MARYVQLVLTLLLVLSPASAQTSGAFKWKFTDSVGETLTECGSLSITLEASGKAPYYMMAFAVDGTPATSLIGTDSSKLAWVVNQPAGKSSKYDRKSHPLLKSSTLVLGSNLLLNVVDSAGSSGGTSALLYTVTAGESTECLPVNTAVLFAMSSNATAGEISTCEPWGLLIKGGQSPYTVTLAALNSPSVTNVTMPAGDNLYTYINRASPNGSLLAAISDSTGKWASGTPYVKTKGDSETTCSGVSSSSGKAPIDDTTTSKPSTSTKSDESTTTNNSAPDTKTQTETQPQNPSQTQTGDVPSKANGAAACRAAFLVFSAAVASVALCILV
ncbi:hypothetical protein D9615_007611 [Tricholomella constricta]|uniref:DOMON domain-containing protein n=1 Tax=Tricholomella constricta TaxID=117010 RepID=A0A8H5M296_9AGAR|nr:hypothetical protein D9615_007611 [Tricholomella constricta]